MHVPKYTLMYSHIPAVYIYTPVYIFVYINIPLCTAKTLYVYICSMLFIYVSYTYPFIPMKRDIVVQLLSLVDYLGDLRVFDHTKQTILSYPLYKHKQNLKNYFSLFLMREIVY